MEDMDPDDDAPKVRSKQAYVEEGGAGKSEEQWGERVEQRQYERVPDKIPGDVAVPGRCPEVFVIEYARLRAIDQHAPEGHLPNHLVQGPLADKELLDHVGEAVEGGTQQGEEVALELVGCRAAVGAGDVVRANQEAHAAYADEDAEVLEELVADAEEDERDDDDDDNSPEVDELGGEDGCVYALRSVSM